MLEIRLKKDRERSLVRRHPWVFSGAIDSVSGEPSSGETVRVVDHKGNFVASAAYSPLSQIRSRVWSFNEKTTIDRAFFERRVEYALALRRDLGFLPLIPQHNTATRLIHGESDGLPGVIVDRYGDTLVAQFLSAGADRWKLTITELLLEKTDCAGVYERSDADVRAIEGLPEVNVPLLGSPESQTLIFENGLRYNVDIAGGHKTGFYLDQRDNRAELIKHSAGKDVLNCFCYTGGFSLAAFKGGANSVVSIDSSAAALEIAQQNTADNGFTNTPQEWIEDNVFTRLRDFRDRGRSFDLIVLDPPKFAATTSQVERASRAYKDINLLGLKMLRPGGLLYTFSCSGGVSAELFQKIVAGADADAGSNVAIVKHLRQSADHPVSLAFPEGAYLKGLVLRKPN